MTIYVAGDSWSARTLNDEANYPQHLALGARLQRLMPDQTVVTVAEPGESTCNQIELAAGLAQPGDVVILGWSDWCREHNIVAGRRGQSIGVAEPQHFSALLDQSLERCAGVIDGFAPWVRVIHWGGQSAVWAPIPDSHTVAYDDYCRRAITAPSRTLSTQTLSTGWSTVLDLERHLTETFLADADLKGVIERALRVNRHCALNPRLFPDGGHLAWDSYDALALRLQQLVQQS